jgi:hypothetical protein
LGSDHSAAVDAGENGTAIDAQRGHGEAMKKMALPPS